VPLIFKAQTCRSTVAARSAQEASNRSKITHAFLSDAAYLSDRKFIAECAA
jgi:hypothetical protein